MWHRRSCRKSSRRWKASGQVIVGGGRCPAVRVDVNPTLLNNLGLGLEDVRTTLAGHANANSPKGQIETDNRTFTLSATDQLLKASEYRPLIVAYRNGAPVRASRRRRRSPIRSRTFAPPVYFNGKPSISLIIFRQPGANIIDTVDRVRALMPQFQAEIPAGIKLHVAMDRTTTIRASVHDVEITLLISRRAGHPRRLPLPAQRADHLHSQHRGAGLADRNVWRDVPLRVQHRQPLADGAGHLPPDSWWMTRSW